MTTVDRKLPLEVAATVSSDAGGAAATWRSMSILQKMLLLPAHCSKGTWIWAVIVGLLASMVRSGSATNEFVWKTGSWMKCMHHTCGDGGIQSRDVWCAHVTGWATLENNCNPHTKPPTTQRCFHICPFHKYHFLWKKEPWSTCRPRHASSKPCEYEYGVQFRNASCVTKCGERPAADYICEHFEERPPMEQICELNCPVDCVLTDFGPWNQCTECWMANHTRYRTVLALPKNGGRECMSLSQSKRCEYRTNCHRSGLEAYKYKIGEWKSCQHVDSKKQRRLRDFIGVLGIRHRDITCINMNGDSVDERFCEQHEKPDASELCLMSRDCLVSGWSNWTVQNRSFQIEQSRDLLGRRRKVVQLPRGTGKGCAPLGETRLATYDEMKSMCFRYKWVTGRWSACEAQLEEEECGAGVQTRVIICVRSTDGTPMQGHLCDLPEPDQVRTCAIPCPQDCVLSPWSEWGECLPHRCKVGRGKTKIGYRVRTRQVLREGLYGGKLCPHLKEIQPCHYPPCYTWQITNPGTCLHKYADMQCGQGMTNRTAQCVSMNHTPVSARLCSEPRPVDRETCYAPCENDCVTSEWSDWTSCSRQCGTGRQAGFRVRQKEILSQASPGGQPCPPSRMLVEKERCNEQQCTTYHWAPGPWSNCHLVGRSCGSGYQSRDAHCYRDGREKVSPKRCPQEERPVTRQNCTIPCPKSCRVSAFTDWTNCPVTCYSEATLEQAYQERHRFVLDHPDHSGQQCPELREHRPCQSLPRCQKYRWLIMAWSECLFPHHYEKCGIGFRARVVKCVDHRSQAVPEEFCIHQLGQMPEVTQECSVTCDVQVCKFSEWSEFTVCSRKCGSYRMRTRTMEGYTSKIAECYDKERYPLEERLPCPCTHYTVSPIDQWSHCILDINQYGSEPEQQPSYTFRQGKKPKGYAISVSRKDGYCGIGRRTQALVCRDDNSYNASAEVCGEKPFMEEMCFIPCPRDCIMSEWSDWTQCHVLKCGNGYQNRSRYMIESELDGGRACPPLTQGEEYQSRPCHVSCDQYTWVTDTWSECDPLSSLAGSGRCGPGLQSRTVRCMRRLGEEEDMVEVDESLCDKLTKPTDINYCHVPCAGQCVVTEWSDWSHCPRDCDSNSRRQRTRSIVRHPANGNENTKCSHLIELETCDEGKNCWRFEWQWSVWGACVLDSGAPCGHGRRRRYKQCLRQGRPVSTENCYKYLGAPEGDGEEQCEVHCPVDCVVSQWSSWTECSVTCGLGFRSRSRRVLIQPADGGRLCPIPLTQQQPCPYHECFRWAPLDWSDCIVPDNSCGYGAQTRTLRCQSPNGRFMPSSYCAELEVPHVQLSRECFSPCPGDCHLSSWSEWGPCHRPCTPEGNEVGEQARSRAILSLPKAGGTPCEPDLWQTRSCDSGPCVSYSWQATPWFGDRRTVWCEASNGVKVTGGCRERDRPSTIKICQPGCDVTHSYCRDVNTCDCVTGYHPIYSKDNVLAECSRKMAGKNGTKGDMTAENMALYFPEDGPTNFWMYAVIAAGSAFVIFVVVALYTVCKGMREDSVKRRLSGQNHTGGGGTKSSEASSSLLCGTHGRQSNKGLKVKESSSLSDAYTKVCDESDYNLDSYSKGTGGVDDYVPDPYDDLTDADNNVYGEGPDPYTRVCVDSEYDLHDLYNQEGLERCRDANCVCARQQSYEDNTQQSDYEADTPENDLRRP